MKTNQCLIIYEKIYKSVSNLNNLVVVPEETGQWNRMKSPDIGWDICGNLEYDKGGILIHHLRNGLFNK